MLRIQGLNRPGINPFGLDLNEGECIALTGPSGAGKSLLLRAIADLDPNQGSVFLDQKNRNEFTAPEWRRRVGYLASESGWWADEAGRSNADIVKASVSLTSTEDFMGFNRDYAKYFGDLPPPTRSTVCSALMEPSALIEIEVLAYVGD